MISSFLCLGIKRWNNNIHPCNWCGYLPLLTHIIMNVVNSIILETLFGAIEYVMEWPKPRLFLQLRNEEILMENIRKQSVNEDGRQMIIEKFYELYGRKHILKNFKNMYNTCKKQYDSFKKLTHNRTCLSYDSIGFIKISDDWWNERCKIFFFI